MFRPPIVAIIRVVFFEGFRIVTVKVKGSRNRPGVAQRVPGGLGSQTSMTFGT